LIPVQDVATLIPRKYRSLPNPLYETFAAKTVSIENNAS